MITLPNQTFFHPTQEFLTFLSTCDSIRYKHIYDIGAGSGKFMHSLRRKKLDVTGVDLLPRENQHPDVQIRDASDIYFGFNDCVFLARPNHGESLRKLIVDMFLNNLSDCYYIGLPKNFDSDLADTTYEVLKENVGEDGESFVRIICPLVNKKKFKTVCHVNGGWWFKEGDKWVNRHGGWNDIRGTEEILKTLVVDSTFDIDFFFGDNSYDNYYQEGFKHKNVWVTPEGICYYVQYTDHDHFCQHMLRITEHRAEELGFLKISGGTAYLNFRKIPLSKPQLDFLAQYYPNKKA